MKKILAILALLPLSATAEYIDHGTYFHDTTTGLYWLKLTESRNVSYDDMKDQFGFGQPFWGWRHAQLEELEYLIEADPYGIPPAGTNCQWGNYCGSVFRQEKLENLIRLFGDTYDAYLDESNSNTDVSPTGKGSTDGYLGERGDPTGTNYWNHVYNVQIRDWEFVDRATGDPTEDFQDRIVVGATNTPNGGSAVGHYLVRTTDPATAGDPTDPNTTQVRLFDSLSPDDLGLSGACDVPYSLCVYDHHEWSNRYYQDYTGTYIWGEFYLYNYTFDQEARPWFRITGYDYHTGGACEADDIDLGNYWCREDLSSDPFSQMPDQTAFCEPYNQPCNGPIAYISKGNDWLKIDNLDMEFIHSNIMIDFDPQNSANTVRPKDSYFFVVGVKTLSTLDGDPVDFDATTIDPATVQLGPNRTPNIAVNPVIRDFDGDGDLDIEFGFRMENTGIGCLDNSVTLVAQTLNGDPLAGQDSILPIDCEETIEMDVDPFNPINTIRPNDSYNVTVAILGMRESDGDAQDVTPGSGTDDDIDPASLKFGPAETGNTSTPIISDVNGDTFDDMLVTFNAFDAGIACEDTELEMTGEKLSGIPVEAMDTIVTEDCDTGGCHP